MHDRRWQQQGLSVRPRIVARAAERGGHGRGWRAAAAFGLMLLATLVMARAAHAAADTKIRSALLSANDVGAGYRLEGVQEIAIPSIDNVVATYLRDTDSAELRSVIVMVQMFDFSAIGAANVDLDGFISGFIPNFEKSSSLTTKPVANPALGATARRFSYSGVLNEVNVVGDMILWQHNEVVGVVTMLNSGAADALDIAQRQEERLTTVYGPLAGVVSVANPSNSQ